MNPALPDPSPLQSAAHLFKDGRLREAEAACRAAVENDPDNPAAWHLLGRLAMREGAAGKAAGFFSRALARYGADTRPERLAETSKSLGDALRATGQLDAAEAGYRRALAFMPRYPEALNNLGALLRQMGRPEEALACFDSALAQAPELTAALLNLARLHHAQGRLEAAADGYRRALATEPGLVEAEAGLGRVLRALGRGAEAEPHLRRALALKPGLATAQADLGQVLDELGRHEEAAAAFEAAIRARPDFTRAYLGLVRCKRFSADDGELLERVEGFVRGAQLAEDDAINLHYALGKIRDDLGEYDRAWRHYAEANRLQHLSMSYDGAEHARLIDRLIQSFTPEFIARGRAAGSDSEVPVFIVGMARSGTTLVEQILSSHPEVEAGGELRVMHQEIMELDRRRYAPEAMRAAAERYLAQLRADAPGARRVTDKWPYNHLHLGVIHLLFPRARILHCVRDPVDTCLSIHFQRFTESHPYACDLEDLAFFYRQYRRLMDHWRRVLPPETLLEVRYEELVADPERVSREMVQFCGLDWDAACLQFHSKAGAVRTPSSWQVRQPIYTRSVQRWRNYEPYIGPLLGLRDDDRA